MKSEQKISEIEELFTRGVEEFIDPDAKFKEKILKYDGRQMDADYILKAL